MSKITEAQAKKIAVTRSDCRFCGSIHVDFMLHFEDSSIGFMSCRECEANGPAVHDESDRDDYEDNPELELAALRAWNRTPDGKAPKRERLKSKPWPRYQFNLLYSGIRAIETSQDGSVRVFINSDGGRWRPAGIKKKVDRKLSKFLSKQFHEETGRRV